MAAEGSPDKADDKVELPVSYGDRVSAVSQWAVAALGTAATAAVAKLSLDRLGSGETDPGLIIWAYVGLVLFAIGVATLIASVVWHVRANRVTIAYLLSGGRLAKKICKMINENAYLLGGADDLTHMRTRLTELVKAAGQGPLGAEDRHEFTRLLGGREAALATARMERMRYVSRVATVLMFFGALAATLGAATFALTTNRDVVLREDRLAEEERERADVVTGDLLPKTPSPVRVVIPPIERERLSVVQALLGAKCDIDSIDAIALEVAQPPPEHPSAPGPADVIHVFTAGSDVCLRRDAWVNPAWVLPPGNPTDQAPPTGKGGEKPTEEASEAEGEE